MINKKIFLDNFDNTLCFKPSDCDGFILYEIENEKNGIYIYYSEIDLLIKKLDNVRRMDKD